MNMWSLLGAAGCLALGLGGGFGVRALSDVKATEVTEEERPAGEGRLRVASISGQSRVLARTGVWRPARKDDVVRRPTGFDVGKGISSLSMVGPDVSLLASHGGRGVLNGPGQPLRIYLEDGHVVVQSPKELVTVVVGRDGTEVSGRSFGVRMQEGRVLVAGVGREVEVRRRGQTNRFPQATEAILSSLGFRQVALPEQLTVDIESVQKAGARWQVRGRTSPTAWVVARDERNAYQNVNVEADGRFTATLNGQQPAAGELIAFDSAGRSAEVGQPSGALDSGPSGARRRAEIDPAPSEPDPLFPDDAAPVAERPSPAASPAAGAAKPAGKPRRGGGGGGGGGKPSDEDSITLGDFGDPAEDAAAEPDPKSVEMPKTETPPAVGAPATKPEKVPSKPKEEDDDEVKLDW